jgi:hypothetical protein
MIVLPATGFGLKLLWHVLFKIYSTELTYIIYYNIHSNLFISFFLFFNRLRALESAASDRAYNPLHLNCTFANFGCAWATPWPSSRLPPKFPSWMAIQFYWRTLLEFATNVEVIDYLLILPSWYHVPTAGAGYTEHLAIQTWLRVKSS